MFTDQQLSNLWCVQMQFDEKREKVEGIALIKGLADVKVILTRLSNDDVEPEVSPPFIKACEEKTGLMSLFGLPEHAEMVYAELVNELESTI